MGDILITDDEADIRSLIADILEDEGYSCRKVGTADQCMSAIEDEAPSLMILDIWLKGSDMDGIDILKSVRRSHPDIPIIIISGHGNIEIAVAAIKQGAYDYIEKPFNIDQLMVVVGRAMETSRLRRENSELRRKDASSAEMIGQSVAYKGLVAQLKKVMNSNGRVMLTGPAGSGKEVAARYIHAKSNRASAPFVSVSSASIEPDRMETVLFGRESPEKGVEPGLLEQAHEGVIYFDEVADMPLGTQSKILRVLVDQAFTRVGGTEKVRVDLRVISSTNRDLDHEIRAGRFREELFHRLNVVPIPVPSLEDRRDDIPVLADYFIAIAEQGAGPAVAGTGRGDQGLAANHALARKCQTIAQRHRARADSGRGDRPDRADRTAQSEQWRRRFRRHDTIGQPGVGAAARGARIVRAPIPDDADQPLRWQHQPHGKLRRDGALGVAP